MTHSRWNGFAIQPFTLTELRFTRREGQENVYEQGNPGPGVWQDVRNTLYDKKRRGMMYNVDCASKVDNKASIDVVGGIAGSFNLMDYP